MPLHLPAAAIALCCLIPWSMTSAVQPPAVHVPPPVAASASSDPFAAAAAARHAKRTACLKEAKAKKRVGNDKNGYVKDCIAH